MDLLKTLKSLEETAKDPQTPPQLREQCVILLKPDTVWAIVCPRCGKKYCIDCAKKYFGQSMLCSCDSQVELVETRNVVDLRGEKDIGVGCGILLVLAIIIFVALKGCGVL